MHALIGPLRKTVDDFWHMIWEHKLNHIVMLTGITEAGKVMHIIVIDSMHYGYCSIVEKMPAVLARNYWKYSFYRLRTKGVTRLCSTFC